MGLTSYYYHSIYFALIFLFVASVTSRDLQEASMYTSHKQWMARYGRIYEDHHERETRFKIFKENVARIESFNTAAANKPYKLMINQFADLTNEEFRASLAASRYNHIVPSRRMKTSFKYENVEALPSEIDWRKKGAVTPIKDLFGCGCSWAFSAVAAVEGITKIRTGKLMSLSEQELVDCGDMFGTTDGAFQFIIQNHGITTETNYPFNGTAGKCNTERAADHAATISAYKIIPANNEEALMKAAAHQPISVSIDAGCFGFQFYGSGILTEDCGTDLNFAVTVVGYGEGDNGVKYWLVKNLWGTDWGEKGYIRMQKDVKVKEGLCGIAMEAAFPET